MGGDEPLDASAVHPEAYPLVQKMLAGGDGARGGRGAGHGRDGGPRDRRDDRGSRQPRRNDAPAPQGALAAAFAAAKARQR